MKKLVFLFLVLFTFTSSVFAQMETNAAWTFKTNKLSDTEFELVFTAQIAANFHMYSINSPKGGPRATTIAFENNDAYELVGQLEATSKEYTEFDEGFGMDVKYYDGEAVLVQKVKLLKPEAVVKGLIDFQTCGGGQCFQGEEEFVFTLKGVVAATEAKEENKAAGAAKDEDESLLMFFLLAFAAGLGGILTPCVFPMIPMTVSFFMSGSDKRFSAIMKGLIFSLSVTLIYTLIGVIVALTKNAGLADFLSTNWVINLIFAIMFIVFATSFFGAFEITLPSSLANKADRQVDKGGYIASFFLAVVLTIVSFSCTGPFVGSILISAAQGGLAIKPIIGMLGFGLALSLPFFFLAIFPSLMKKLPKSGGWLNAVKVVFAFIMLAFSMKFIDVVDTALGWNFITRDVYLAVWIVIFVLLGMYLLGKIKFSHDSDTQHVGIFRLFLAIASFTFAIYLIPGLFGAPLSTIAALTPGRHKQVFDLTKTRGAATPVSNITGTIKYADRLHAIDGLSAYFDINEGLEAAKKQNKPVLIDFTGEVCSNCKIMENKVFMDQRVLDYINQNFVLVELYVDVDMELPESEWITGEDGKVKKTMKAKNREYQSAKFKQFSQPYFVVVDQNENKLIDGVGLVTNPNEFLEWLQKGFAAYQNK